MVSRVDARKHDCADASADVSNAYSQIMHYFVGPDKLYIANIRYTQDQFATQIEALDFQTGQVLWVNHDAFAYNQQETAFSPFYLVRLQQNTLLVGNGSPLVAGFDADNGHILWQINGSESPAVVQIVASAP